MSPLQKRLYLNEQIEERIAHWKYVYENGSGDPFWADGVNLNLIRNHVIYYLRQLKELEEKPTQMSLFEVMDSAPIDLETDSRIPQKVEDEFMAKDRELYYYDTVRRRIGVDDER